MNAGAVLAVAIFFILAFAPVFGAGYIVGRAGGFRELFDPPDSPRYPTMRDAPDEMRRRDLEQRYQEGVKRGGIHIPAVGSHQTDPFDRACDYVGKWRGATWDELTKQEDGIT